MSPEAQLVGGRALLRKGRWEKDEIAIDEFNKA